MPISYPDALAFFRPYRLNQARASNSSEEFEAPRGNRPSVGRERVS